jgi:type IV secretion system protein TrbL
MVKRGKSSVLRRWLWLLLLIVFAGAVVEPLGAFAQTGITSPDTSDGTFTDSTGGTPAGPSTIVGTFQQATSSWMTNMEPIALGLFWALAGIDFTWTCITLVLQYDDLKSWMAGFIRKILTIGFFAALLTNGSTWIADIVNFFISAGGTAGGVNISNMNASNIMGLGLKIAGNMLTGGPNPPSNATTLLNLFTNPVGSVASALLIDLGCLIILISYVLIALHFVMAMVEAYVTLGAGYLFLGFGGSRWTVPYTEKYLGMVVHAGVRIMVLEMMIGLGSKMAAEWNQMALKINSVPGILGASASATVSGSFTGVQLLFALLSSVMIFGLCCWTIPQIAANVASGGLSMSGGDAVGGAVASATAAYAGAHFASTAGTSTGSQMGNSKDVESIAQTASMKGAEMGMQLAMAAGTGGASAVASGAMEAGAAAGASAGGASMGAAASGVTGGGEAAVVGLTPAAPSSGESGSGTGSGGMDSSSGSGSGASSGGMDSSSSGGSGGSGSSSGEGGSGKDGSDSSDVGDKGADAPPPSSPGGGGSDVFSDFKTLHKGLNDALGKLPEDGGQMGGVTPKVDHGE